MKGCHTNNRTSGYTTTQKVNKNLRYGFKNFILWLKQLTYVGVWPECLISTIKEARKLNTKTKTLFTVSSTPQLVSNTGKNFLLRLMIWQPDGTAICANVKQLLSLCCKEIKNIKRDGWDEVGTDFGKKNDHIFQACKNLQESIYWQPYCPPSHSNHFSIHMRIAHHVGVTDVVNWAQDWWWAIPINPQAALFKPSVHRAADLKLL